MSRGGAWDSGPPGAEGDYDPAYSRYPAPPPATGRSRGPSHPHSAPTVRHSRPRREPSPAARRARPRASSPSSSSESSRSASSSNSSGDRHTKRWKSTSQKKINRSKHSDGARKSSPRRQSRENQRRSLKPSQPEHSTLASFPSKTSQKTRERSITPPRSFKRGPRASSSSSSSARSSPSRSRSRSASPRRRSRSTKRIRKAQSHTSSPSPLPPNTPTRSRHHSRSDSDSSSRGHFSGYDRKRYWRNIKEKQPRSPERTGEEIAEVTEDTVAVGLVELEEPDYRDPPPLPEGLNFEDLPPPPDELFNKPKKTPVPLCIRNDGSFLEMFKKMQEECAAGGTGDTKVAEAPRRPTLPFIGKRRGGRVLKTGIVKKAKATGERPAEDAPKDAWSLYMQEVKKYRETSCEEERKTRPLVK